MAILTVLAQTEPAVGTDWTDFGAIGISLTAATIGLIALGRWIKTRHEAEIAGLRADVAYERTRSDRFEAQLNANTQTMTELVVPTIVRATDLLDRQQRHPDGAPRRRWDDR